jgi:hypothetical protein
LTLLEASPVPTPESPPVLKFELLLPVLALPVTTFKISVTFCCKTVTRFELFTLTVFSEKAPFLETLTDVFPLQPQLGVTLAVLDEPPVVTLTLLVALPVTIADPPPVLKLEELLPVLADELTDVVILETFVCETVVPETFFTFTVVLENAPFPLTFTLVFANAAGANALTKRAADAIAVVNLYLFISFHLPSLWASFDIWHGEKEAELL